MKLETELKFSVLDFDAVTKELIQVQAESSVWYFEQNIVLDDEHGTLRKKDYLLRLRTGLADKLTLKTPVSGHKSDCVKHRMEYETELGSTGEMQDIFNKLGYYPFLRYEKFRQIWRIDKFKVCLDILPFGRFVEIEAELEQIEDFAGGLGLDVARSTSKTYHELNQDYLRQHGLEPDMDFVFEEHERRRLALELGVQMEKGK